MKRRRTAAERRAACSDLLGGDHRAQDQLAPVVALVAGIVVLGESPGAGTLLGLPLILVGSALATGED